MSLSCVMCGERLPKYTLDRFSDEFCGEACAGVRRGAAVAFGLMGMAEAIRANEEKKQRIRDHEDRMLEAEMGS